MLKKLLLPILFVMGIGSVYPIEDIYDGKYEARDLGYKIEFFEARDLSKDSYWISVSSKDPQKFLEAVNKGKTGTADKKSSHFYVTIGNIKTDNLAGTAFIDPDNNEIVTFQVISYYPIRKSGVYKIRLLYEGIDPENKTGPIGMYELDVFNHELIAEDAGPEKQPLIDKVDPKGGQEGSTITIQGKGFGEDIDDITIEFVGYEPFTNDDGITIERYITDIRPFYLSSPGQDKMQNLKFSIPYGRNLLQKNVKGSDYNVLYSFRNPTKLRVIVKGRPSDYVTFSILPADWKMRTGILSLIVIALFLGLIGAIIRKFNYMSLVMLESTTNTYSLSKFQAFAWTLVLIGAYFYLAISHGLLLRNGKIPDFNASLLGLMSISYGGLMTAQGFGSKKPKNEMSDTPPHWSNLFMEGGNISLPRLQLFGFTVVAIIVYLYTLYLSNPLGGLPDIPPTLLGLLGVSQGGYLGDKALGDKVHVNIVSPKEITIDQENVKITLVGSGFVPETSVLLEESEPIKSTFINGNSISFVVPKFSSAGAKTLTLIPPSGSPSTYNSLFTVLELQEVSEEKPDAISTEPLDLPQDTESDSEEEAEEEIEK